MAVEFALQVQNLTRRFGGILAVDGLSLSVPPGEIFGFLGPNGAGKTTSIQMMVGLLQPTSGDVLIAGQSIRGRRASVLRRVGVCPQENILWEKLTCLEQLEFLGVNYGMTARQARQRGSELLEMLGLPAKANQLAGRLSGGMKRRLNLALALIHDPQLVFLDEPEAGLDPQSRVLVRDTIRLLAHRKTVILTTHNMDEAERLADRVAIIDHGRLIVVDTPAELKRRCGSAGVLEIELGTPAGVSDTAALQTLLSCLGPQFPDAQFAHGLLTLRGPDLSARLPVVLQQLGGAGFTTGSIQLRAATLEDVFLALTGRGLRE
jgi:ABC-2 type transport system ATP-binding protein